MKFGFVAFVLVSALALCVSTGFGADEKAAQPQMDAATKAYMEAATPGAPHKMLANMVGTWDTVMSDFTSGQTGVKGTATFASLMDGRYVQESMEGTFSGMPFHGTGTYGYDNVMKKYVGTWIDNFGTGILMMEGKSDDGGKTLMWSGNVSNPLSGKQDPFRSVVKMISQDQYSYEMYGAGPDGKEMKMMEISYSRKK